MKIEMGESLFYSWLRHVKDCQVVQTNWKVSPQWEMKHRDEIRTFMEVSDQHFTGRYGYKIFKKNSSLSQVIQQGECDAVGISVQAGTISVYAVDVAFHEGGLNYGTRQETVMKIVAKSLRTAIWTRKPLKSYLPPQRFILQFSTMLYLPLMMQTNC